MEDEGGGADAAAGGNNNDNAEPFFHGKKARGKAVKWVIWAGHAPFRAEVLYPHDNSVVGHLRGRVNVNASRKLTVTQAKAFMSPEQVSTFPRLILLPV